VAADQLSLALTTPVSKSERRRNTRPAVHDRRLAVKPCVRQATAVRVPNLGFLENPGYPDMFVTALG